MKSTKKFVLFIVDVLLEKFAGEVAAPGLLDQGDCLDWIHRAFAEEESLFFGMRVDRGIFLRKNDETVTPAKIIDRDIESALLDTTDGFFLFLFDLHLFEFAVPSFIFLNLHASDAIRLFVFGLEDVLNAELMSTRGLEAVCLAGSIFLFLFCHEFGTSQFGERVVSVYDLCVGKTVGVLLLRYLTFLVERTAHRYVYNLNCFVKLKSLIFLQLPKNGTINIKDRPVVQHPH